MVGCLGEVSGLLGLEVFIGVSSMGVGSGDMISVSMVVAVSIEVSFRPLYCCLALRVATRRALFQSGTSRVKIVALALICSWL